MSAVSLHIRPAVAADQDFFVELYRATRDDLLGLLADPRYIDALVLMQQQMQAADYRRRYPEALYQVLELDGVPVGRLVTAEVEGALRVVDIAVIPAARGRGVASETLRRLQEEAVCGGHDLRLAVRTHNAGARRLYAVLGFEVEQEDAASLQLRWRAQPPA